MVDKLEAFAAAERAGLLRNALRGKVAEINGEIEDLRRQVTAREQERDFFQAEDDKAAATYDGVVKALVGDGMTERKARDTLDARIRLSVDANVEVQVPVPGGRGGRGPAPRRTRAVKADPAGPEQQPGVPADQADAEAPSDARQDAAPEPASEPAGRSDAGASPAEDGGMSLPSMGGHE